MKGEVDRRGFFRHVGLRLLSVAAASAVSDTLLVACSPRGGSGVVPSGGSAATVSVTSALQNASTMPMQRRQVQPYGMKIIEVDVNGRRVHGESIVYTVNGALIYGQSNSDPNSSRFHPDNYQVKTGDVIDIFDVVNGSRASLVVVVP